MSQFYPLRDQFQHWLLARRWEIFAVFVLACAGGWLQYKDYTNSRLKWTEDVLLPDGRIVTLTRYQEFKGPHKIGDTPTQSDYWFEFKHPDTGEIVRWHYGRHLGTVALLIDQATPYLLLSPRFGSSLSEFKCPNPPYLLFKYRAGAWQRVELKEIPVRRLRSNLSYAVREDRKQIAAQNYHRSLEQTQASEFNYRPWVMDFSRAAEQTFEPSNCFKKSDYLLVQ